MRNWISSALQLLFCFTNATKAALFDSSMHQNRLSTGALPQTSLGELTVVPGPDLLVGFKGPTSKGTGGDEWIEGSTILQAHNYSAAHYTVQKHDSLSYELLHIT